MAAGVCFTITVINLGLFQQFTLNSENYRFKMYVTGVCRLTQESLFFVLQDMKGNLLKASLMVLVCLHAAME